MQKAKLIISGLVQGVGFRYFAKREAQKSNLMGYIKNLPDGKIESVVEGSLEAIGEFTEALRRGPSHSNVEELDIKYEDFTGEFRGFRIL